jgi:hypothetical protein
MSIMGKNMPIVKIAVACLESCPRGNTSMPKAVWAYGQNKEQFWFWFLKGILWLKNE